MPDLRERLQEALSGSYQLERELGRGGMATVYLARDLKHDRLVALKVMHRDLAAALGSERFLREVKLVARLQHPHILPVHDSGDAAGQLWYTMPFVRGESLRDRLRREVQLPVDVAVELARQVALALDCAHREGVVHRDLKPENILLSDGQALVADFGVAKALTLESESQLTATGMAVGCENAGQSLSYPSGLAGSSPLARWLVVLAYFLSALKLHCQNPENDFKRL